MDVELREAPEAVHEVPKDPDPVVTRLSDIMDGAPDIWVRIVWTQGIQYWEMLADEVRENLTGIDRSEDIHDPRPRTERP